MQVCQARAQYIRWLVATKDFSPHTIRAYEGDIAAFNRALGIWAPVRDITRDALVDFMERQKEEGLSARSIRRRASALRGLCRWLLARGLLEIDPWTGISVPVGRARKLPRVVAEDDLERLLSFLRDAAHMEDGAVADAVLVRPHEATTLLAVVTMLATGVRVHEVCGIECRNIDVRGRGVRLVGKGRRERQVFLPNQWIADFVRSYMRMRTERELAHPYLLFNRRLNPLTPPALRSRLTRVARDAGVSTSVTPHMLRHTAATQLIEAGVDIRYIQRLLGHASLTTTEIYTHVSNRALKQVVSEADVLGRLLEAR